MLKVVGMGNPSRRVKWDTRVSIWSHAEAKEALSTVKNRLRRSGKLRFRGLKMTEEVVFAALCLWADAQDVTALGETLAPFVAQLEEIVKGDEGSIEVEGGEALREGEKGPAARPTVPTRKGKPKPKKKKS